MSQPMNTASRTKAMNPPISGQYMAVNIYEAGRTGDRERRRRAARRSGQAWSATCSLGDGNAQATWSRRSWRKTKRSWLGGRRPSGCAGRNVAQGPVSAHRAQQVLTKEAVLAARLRRRPTIRHTSSYTPF